MQKEAPKDVFTIQDIMTVRDQISKEFCSNPCAAGLILDPIKFQLRVLLERLPGNTQELRSLLEIARKLPAKFPFSIEIGSIRAQV